jgi:transposase InsO family protein
VEEQCWLAEVSRAGYYRRWEERASSEEAMHLRHRVQQIVLANGRRRGYRYVTAELRREGNLVNHKRVWRIMHDDNLLCLRSRKYVLTTDSEHEFRVYPNLVPSLKVTGTNQLWVADITYIRLLEEFIYLAVVLDAYSRRVVGWALDQHLQASLAVVALRMALRERQCQRGVLVHHSDQGVQYGCPEYTEILADQDILISMSRRGNPYDNAKAERFMRTLKEEEVYCHRYRNLEEARSSIGYFLEEVYNRRRLHSALQYRTPEEFEATGKAVETDGTGGNGGKPKAGFPPFPQPLKIPSGFSQFPQHDDDALIGLS